MNPAKVVDPPYIPLPPTSDTWPTGPETTVSTKTIPAIQAAIDAAATGTTVVCQAGTYIGGGTLYLKDGVYLKGQGIYKQAVSGGGGGTWIQSNLRWGSHSFIGYFLIGNAGGSSFRPQERGGASSRFPVTNVSGSHGDRFFFTRFTGNLELGNNFRGNDSGGWAASSHGVIDMYDTKWFDCEWQRHSVATGIANLWFDCRDGGSQLHDLEWTRNHFGVKDTEGLTGIGRVFIIQPSPAEHCFDGPRPTVTSSYPQAAVNLVGTQYDPNDSTNGWYPNFDWSQVDHGAYNISLTDCLFEYADWVATNPCDYARSYSIWKGNETGLPGTLTYALTSDANRATGWGNGPQENWMLIPTKMWMENYDVTRCYFKGGVSGGPRYELCRNSASVDCNTGGSTSYGNTRSGVFSNDNRPSTSLFTVDWTGTGSSYTPSPFDPA